MIRELMADILREAPLLEESQQRYGNLTLGEYCDMLARKGQEVTEEIMPSGDVTEAVRAYLSPLVGEEPAEQTAQQVLEQKLLLTANHHEVEYCVQALQGNLLYDYVIEKMGFKEGIVPIFSNTTVNMSNENFPRGIQVYHTHTQMERFPIFPFKQRNSLVAAAEGFTRENLMQTRKNILRNQINGTLEPRTAECMVGLLEQVYQAEEVLKEKQYAKQAVIVNQVLGKRLFCDSEKNFIYIELEEISTRLLLKDLQREDGLVEILLFREEYRKKLTQELEGKTGCWDTKGRKGTWFFWGIDAKKRRVSMVPQQRGEKMYLTGVDMEGNEYTYPFDRESVVDLLHERRILPGLFLSFLELYFLRSFTMAGGCFQNLYLKDMNEGLCHTLAAVGGHEHEIAILREKQCWYLSGPMFLLGYHRRQSEDRQVFPLGTIEILERGGITGEQFRDALQITMSQAQEVGIYNFYTDLIPKSQWKDRWYQNLSGAFSRSSKYPESIWFEWKGGTSQ